MTLCESVSDRMAAIAQGRGAWTATEAAHLAACAECAAEWRLVGVASGLGARLPALDPARIAGQLHRRLATAPAEVVPLLRRRPVRWAIGLAAAAAVVFAIRTATPPPGQPERAPVTSVLTELDELSGQELASVLEVFDVDDKPPAVDGPGLGDLTSDELERLLRGWEG